MKPKKPGNSALNQTLHQAIELSKIILQAIEQEDWDRVTPLDDERSELIEQFFNNATEIDKADVQKLKQLNDEIVAKLLEMQQNNRLQQASLSRSQKAANAYLDNT